MPLPFQCLPSVHQNPDAQIQGPSTSITGAAYYSRARHRLGTALARVPGSPRYPILKALCPSQAFPAELQTVGMPLPDRQRSPTFDDTARLQAKDLQHSGVSPWEQCFFSWHPTDSGCSQERTWIDAGARWFGARGMAPRKLVATP